MALLDYFRRKKTASASVAKERLQIILAHEHSHHEPDYLPALKRDLLDVITKYVHVDHEDISVKLDKDGDCDILELNISLPEKDLELTAADQR
ncbi:MAG: cell division topological specificity factor MinE [Gammaproteobacteria bacterium]|nr:cell division topological specificity factor MinE [Gammaproteobacteria bacterium]